MPTRPWDYWSQYPLPPLGENLSPTPPENAAVLPPPVVTVFGAGIAGLSAAHELVERGFTVQLVEPAESTTDEYECQVGGMAANQLSRVPADIRTLYQGLAITSDEQARLQQLRSRFMRPTQRRFPLTQRIRCKRGQPPAQTLTDEYAVTNLSKLRQVLETLKTAIDLYRQDYEAALAEIGPGGALSTAVRCREILLVSVRGFTDTDFTAEHNRLQSRVWADSVRTQLLDLNSSLPDYQIPNLEEHLVAQGCGDVAPLGDQSDLDNRTRSNRVEFHIVEQIIPGEHGFRFFPSCYRHLFDTMRRTPVMDADNKETTETAFDRLVAVPEAALALKGLDSPHDVNVRQIFSLKDLQRIMSVFLRKLRFTDRDVLLLQTSMLEFLTSCRGRREAKTEGQTFWDYIGGATVGYSPAAERFITAAPKALAAMSATETDARTQLTLIVQMLLKSPFDTPRDDFTLDASSTDAWLNVWKCFLRERGVKFFVGHLKELTRTTDGVMIPSVTGPADWLHPRPERPTDAFFDTEKTDFFVLAVPFEQASEFVWHAYNSFVPSNQLDTDDFSGPFGQLLDFDDHAKRRDKNTGNKLHRARAPQTGAPETPTDPLRDISGIQYFFRNNYRIGHGHVYFVDSEWALTAISQLAYWRDRTQPIGGYIGQSSVDIGDWYKPFPQNGPSAWHSTREEIAEKTWSQMRESLPPLVAAAIVDPQYYHLDEGISFVDEQYTGYIGDAFLLVDGPVAAKTQLQIEVEVTDGASPITAAIEFTAPNDMGSEAVAAILADLLSRTRGGTLVHAWAQESTILVSPYCARPDGVVIAVRGPTDAAVPLNVAAAGRAFSVHGEPQDVMRQLVSWARPWARVTERLGSGSIRIRAERPIAVSHPHNLIEIIDGPQLAVRVANRKVLVLSARQRGSTRRTKIRLAKELRLRMLEPDPGRVYQLILTADGVQYPAVYEAEADDTKERLCKQLARALRVSLAQKLTPQTADDGIKTEPVGADDWDLVLSFPSDSPLGSMPFEYDVKDMAVLALKGLLPLRNGTPFLINLPNQWRLRPGFVDPTVPQVDVVIRGASKGPVRNAFEYGHDPQGPFRRWVVAGTFMATFTRMTTMEAANESARHAVNAILRAIAAVHPQEDPPLFNCQGHLMGDPCDIWDPEEHELEDLDYFKQLDHALLEKGLPHFFDILGLRDLIERIPPGDGARLELWNELVDMLIQTRTFGFANVAAASAFAKAAKI